MEPAYRSPEHIGKRPRVFKTLNQSLNVRPLVQVVNWRNALGKAITIVVRRLPTASHHDIQARCLKPPAMGEAKSKVHKTQ